MLQQKVQYGTPDDGQRNCPKHVEFYYRINLDKNKKKSGKHVVFTDLPENRISFAVWDYLTLKMKALPSIETSLTMYRMTRRNKPENLNLQDTLSVVFLFFFSDIRHIFCA
jgi:hypothetical protein